MQISRRGLLAAGAAALFVPTFVRASANGHMGAIYSDAGRAIRGSDPVAFFTEGAAVAGDPGISTRWMGADWFFASQANREAFEMDPKSYAPQYGGYCAFAASKGAAASTEPQAWTIHEGKLYLNYSLNVRGLWRQDIPGNIDLANGHWPNILEALTA